MLNNYSDCKSPSEVHAKLKADTNNYFDKEGCKKLIQYGRQYIPYNEKPKNIPDLLDAMEMHGKLGVDKYDNLKKLVERIDQRMLNNIIAAEDAIVQMAKESKEKSYGQGCQEIADIKKPFDVIKKDVNSLQNNLSEDDKPKKIEELIKELGDMVEIMPEEQKDQYNSLKKATSNRKRHFKAIIIAGETCAGKTTLINLLIDCNLFEESNNPSTSAMVFLHYKEVYTIEVYSREKKGEKLKSKIKKCDIPLFSNFKKHVNEYTRTATNCVHIFYPAPVLKHGIVLVDTPSLEGLDAVTDFFKETPPQQILACVFVMNATCSNWRKLKNGEVIPMFLFELLECIKETDLLLRGEISFLINKWETVMTTGEDKKNFEEDAWFHTQHRILFSLKDHLTNMDNRCIYKVSLGNMGLKEDEPYKHFRREYSRFEDYIFGLLEKRNMEILTDLTNIADQCRSIMEKQLKKIKKEQKKHKKSESGLKGNLTKLEKICPSAEIEDSDSDFEEIQEKFLKTRKKRKRELDDQT